MSKSSSEVQVTRAPSSYPSIPLTYLGRVIYYLTADNTFLAKRMVDSGKDLYVCLAALY